MIPLVSDLGEPVESHSGLARRARAVAESAPIVDSVVRLRSTDSRHIEQAPDRLPGFCFDPEAPPLDKELCRHDDFIDPAAAPHDVQHAYRAWHA
jgi:hypothetical protein